MGPCHQLLYFARTRACWEPAMTRPVRPEHRRRGARSAVRPSGQSVTPAQGAKRLPESSTCIDSARLSAGYGGATSDFPRTAMSIEATVMGPASVPPWSPCLGRGEWSSGRSACPEHQARLPADRPRAERARDCKGLRIMKRGRRSRADRVTLLTSTDVLRTWCRWRKGLRHAH